MIIHTIQYVVGESQLFFASQSHFAKAIVKKREPLMRRHLI